MLNKRGINVSIKKVSNEMHFLGIKSIHKEKFPKKKSRMSDEEKALIVNLIHNINITAPNQVWTTDITYIKTKYDSTLYLISFIDQFSKRVIAWYLSKSQKATDVSIALNMAIKKRKPFKGLIVHSDKGSQFRSKIYRDILIKHHFIYSYTELNHSCDQNPSQESFHATLKKECIYNITLYHFEDAYKVIFDYIEGFYNPKRIHSSIGDHSPIEFENFYYNSKKEGKTPSETSTKY